MKTSQRAVEIDVMRGLLVLLVVLGHVAQQYGNSLGPGWRQLLIGIYSFHMPAFAIVAGLCMRKAVGLESAGERFGYIKVRAWRLLVPYFFWGVVYFILRAFLGGCVRVPYQNNLAWMFPLGYTPFGAGWFLWTLFVASAIVALFGRWLMSVWGVGLLGAAAILFRLYVPYVYWLPSSVYYIPLYVFALMLGVWIRSRYEQMTTALRRLPWLLLAIVLFAAVQWIIAINFKPWFPWYVLASALAGFLFLALALQVVRLPGRWIAPLVLLGTEAMAIYVIGEPVKVLMRQVLIKWPVQTGLSMTIMMATMIVGSVLLSRLVLCRCKWLSELLLGTFRPDEGERRSA